MIAIEVKRCAACGALEDVHTSTAADGTTTITLECACGRSEAREVVLASGEGYWLEIPVVHMKGEGQSHESDDSGDVLAQHE